MKKYLNISLIAVLVIMHAVGFFGLLSSERDYYNDLTAVNLMITTVCFLLGTPSSHLNYVLVFLFAGTAGLIAEIVGVKTGMVFGEYHYSDQMGYKVADVPMVIGLNWAVLTLAIASFIRYWGKNVWIKAVAGASLMTLMDIFIEPIAQKLNYWQWKDGIIPLQNYLAWWLISFGLFLVVEKTLKDNANKIGFGVYIIQLMFFIGLNLLLK